MAPTRVLILIDQFFSPDGGTEQQLRGLLAGLGGLGRRLRSGRWQVLHTYFPEAVTVGPWLAAAGGVPLLTSRRDLGFWYTPARLFWLRAGRRFTRRWLANSEAVRATVCARECAPAARVDVIPNALDLGPLAAVVPLDIRAELRLPPQTAVLVLPANLRPVKGVDLAIAALADLVLNTSHSEGSSNAVLEAMALGDRGRLAAWGRQARARVTSRQDAGAVVRRYQEIYHATAAGGIR